MSVADEAGDNAIHCEMVKYAYRQSKDGVVVSFVVHPDEVPAALSTSRIGARYVVALVQVGDDELPIKQTAKENKRHSPTTSPATASLETGKPKRRWEEMQPQQQAGMRCGEPAFIAFLKETRPDDWHESQDAAECVRLICGVHSRVELGTNPKARVIWTQLDFAYAAWKALEHA